jgi:hypothetical protein
LEAYVDFEKKLIRIEALIDSGEIVLARKAYRCAEDHIG